MSIKTFIDTHYKHFNAAALKDAAKGWVKLDKAGGKMFLSLAGAMSTAEIGISLAEMIRRDKIHAIASTGANLEEDIFNLVANSHYKRVPDYRYLSAADEEELRKQGFNRVTDTCIPEGAALKKIEAYILKAWQEADEKNERLFPYEFIYRILDQIPTNEYDIDPKHSWVLAAKEKGIPIYTPGWEDSTLGNIIVSHYIKKDISTLSIVKTGLEMMIDLIGWYEKNSQPAAPGFFQIAGGIAGDFPICVVPLIRQDLDGTCPLWAYFCQISDSTTSYGSYSGAVPNEKITWEKLGVDTPSFVIESDASIVAPLIFSYVLESTS